MDQSNNALGQVVQDVVTSTVLPEDKKVELTDELTHLLLKRVFSRVVQVLTQADMQKIDELDKEDATGNSVKYFLLSKIPHLQEIVTEEASLLQTHV